MSSSIHVTPNEALIGRRIAMNVAPLGLDPLEVLPRIEHLRALLGSLTLPSAAARSVAPIEEVLGEAIRILHLEDPGLHEFKVLEPQFGALWSRREEPDTGRRIRDLYEGAAPWLSNDDLVLATTSLLKRVAEGVVADRLPIDSWSVLKILGVAARELWLRKLAASEAGAFGALVSVLADHFQRDSLREPDAQPLEALRYAHEVARDEALARTGLVELIQGIGALQVPGPGSSPAAQLAARNILGW
jgi:hypothetical protein